MKRRIKREFSMEKATVRIGKSGVTPQLLEEVDRQLEKNEIVKVKILKSALAERKAREVASEVAQKTNASLVEVRGHTFILYRRKKKVR
ncbi:RNA-binding protein [Candidatus Bathyarchaeota archaeon]|nr:MAG: RNA-binding protein [Candidatus Bathyarchaeota archaeon]